MKEFSCRPALSLWVLSFVLTVCSECATASEQGWGTWLHPLGQAHPLAGRVWDVKNGTWVDPEALALRLADATRVLLGEKHDNADHHRLQAWVIRSLATAGRRPAVAFEMLDTDEQSLIDRQLERAPTDASGLRAVVRWDDRGWPEWELYEPVFGAAMAERLPIVAANLSPATTREMARRGISAVSPDLVCDFGLNQPLPPELARRMADDIESSHCGQVSRGATEKMMLIQRTRDAHMARRLIGPQGTNGAVLIAGAFHVRNDYGVPAQLAKLDSKTGVVSVGFIEVRDDRVAPGLYARAFGMKELPFDYVWFTTRVDDEDPCEKFAEQLQQMKGKPDGPELR